MGRPAMLVASFLGCVVYVIVARTFLPGLRQREGADASLQPQGMPPTQGPSPRQTPQTPKAPQNTKGSSRSKESRGTNSGPSTSFIKQVLPVYGFGILIYIVYILFKVASKNEPRGIIKPVLNKEGNSQRKITDRQLEELERRLAETEVALKTLASHLEPLGNAVQRTSSLFENDWIGATAERQEQVVRRLQEMTLTSRTAKGSEPTSAEQEAEDSPFSLDADDAEEMPTFVLPSSRFAPTPDGHPTGHPSSRRPAQRVPENWAPDWPDDAGGPGEADGPIPGSHRRFITTQGEDVGDRGDDRGGGEDVGERLLTGKASRLRGTWPRSAWGFSSAADFPSSLIDEPVDWDSDPLVAAENFGFNQSDLCCDLDDGGDSGGDGGDGGGGGGGGGSGGSGDGGGGNSRCDDRNRDRNCDDNNDGDHGVLDDSCDNDGDHKRGSSSPERANAGDAHAVRTELRRRVMLGSHTDPVTGSEQ
ncbi:uncharacterized protein LOC144936589 [Lampetra fluviatilis]